MPKNDGATVYILQSQRYPNRFYSGITRDLRRRLAEHNAGDMPSTCGLRPLQIHVAL